MIPFRFLKTSLLLGTILCTSPVYPGANLLQGTGEEAADAVPHTAPEQNLTGFSNEEALLLISPSHKSATVVNLDDETKDSLSHRRGKDVAEIMCLFISPAIKYGLPILFGTLAITFIAGTGGVGGIIIPFVVLVPVTGALGKKFSEIALRIPALALKSEAAESYVETLKSKGYEPAPSLPFEETLCKFSRTIYSTFTNGWSRIKSLVSPSSPQKTPV